MLYWASLELGSLKQKSSQWRQRTILEHKGDSCGTVNILTD